MPSILIVEDDNDLRQVLVNKFAKLNLITLQAADGQEGIDLAFKEQPEVILLDLLLPKVDGFAVLKAIRENKNPKIAAIPVIVLSNLWSNKDILQAESLKIEKYYVKANTDLEEVVASVSHILTKPGSH